MLMPCENIIKVFLPAMKSSITKELMKKYNFTQVDVATTLGLTQAAISKYLSGRYSKVIKNVEKNENVKKMAERIAHSIAKENASKSKVVNLMCKSCIRFTGSECNLPQLEKIIESMIR